jgi:Protein of unknown function (DUF2946)
MLRRAKTSIAITMLVLYTGMMLGGESLHLLLGCGGDQHAATCVSQADATLSRVNGPAVESGAKFVHDEDSCPICQFHAQGQLAPSLASNPIRQVLSISLPVQPTLVLAAATPGIYSPRGPPMV